MQKIEQWEARDKEIEDLVDEGLEIENNQNMVEEDGNYVEPVDFTASQDTVESFGNKLGIKHGLAATK